MRAFSAVILLLATGLASRTSAQIPLSFDLDRPPALVKDPTTDPPNDSPPLRLLENPDPNGDFDRGGFMNGLGPMGGFGGFGSSGPLNGTVTWMPNQNVAGESTHLGYIRQQTNANVPLWLDGPDKLLFTTSIRTTWYSTNAIFPDTLRPFPTDIWNVNFGLTFIHKFDNDWTLGVSTHVGSASDQPFSTIHEMYFGVSAFLRVPSGERNSWLFSIMYNPTGEFNFPIPGVAYMWVPNDNFSMNIGIPFALKWVPFDDWTFTFSYMPVRSINTKLAWDFHKDWQAYIGFNWINEASYLSDRTDDEERLFYYEKHFQTGVRYDLSRNVNLDLFGGYAFDRFYFTGRSYSDRNHDRIDVGDGFYAGLRLGIKF